MNTTLLIYPIEKSRCSFKWKRAAPFAGSDLPARARAMLVLTEFAKLLRSLRMGVLFAAV
jgi:hypothetical protein